MRSSSVLLLLAVIATPLSAQFRIPKPKVPTPTSVPGVSAPHMRMPTYDDRVLEINDARLTSLMAGLKTAKDQKPALERAYKKNADDRAAAEVAFRRQNDAATRWSQCLISVSGIDTIAMASFDRRMRAAEQRGDNREVTRLQDSMMQAQMNEGGKAAMAQAEAIKPGGKCGPAPKVNTAPAQALTVPPPPTPLGDSLQILSAAAAGMTVEQFAVMQERVLAFLTTSSHDLGSSPYAYSPMELHALQGKRSELAKYQDVMTEQ